MHYARAAYFLVGQKTNFAGCESFSSMGGSPTGPSLLDAFMPDLAVWVGVLVVMVGVAVWLVRKFRDSTAQEEQRSFDDLTNFQEMRQKGDIDDAEFRTIKSVLGTRLRREINDDKGKG